MIRCFMCPPSASRHLAAAHYYRDATYAHALDRLEAGDEEGCLVWLLMLVAIGDRERGTRSELPIVVEVAA